MFRVILTGGIASGKSTASEHFEQLGVTVIDADLISRELVQPGEAALARIVQHFGRDILNADGRLNRPALRTRVFAQPQERRILEEILHPMIRQRMLERAEIATSPYVILVVPLYVETGQAYPCERVLLIDSPEQLQKARLTARDASKEDQIEQLLAAQATRQQRLTVADDVICNDGNPDQLRQAVEKIHHRYLHLAEKDSSRV